MKKIKQVLQSKKKDGKDNASISSRVSECADTGYEVKGDVPKLHLAAWSGSVQKVKSLLSSGKFDVDELDNEGRTALHLACARGHSEVCKELLANNAKSNLEDRAKKTALLKAIECTHAGCVQQLAANKANVTVIDQNGDSALHHAVKTGDVDVVRAILNAGVKLDLKNREGLNPLLLAVTLKYDEIAAALLEKGANVNTTTPKGRTALMIACEQNAPNTVGILLRYKANTGIEDQKGQTAEDTALFLGHHDCAELIGRARDVRRSSVSGSIAREYEDFGTPKSVSGAAAAQSNKKEDARSVASSGSLRKKDETPKSEKKSKQATPPELPKSVPATPSAKQQKQQPQPQPQPQQEDDDWSDSESLSIGVKKPVVRLNMTVPRVNSVDEVPPTTSTPDKKDKTKETKGAAKPDESDGSDWGDSDGKDEVKDKAKVAAAPSASGKPKAKSAGVKDEDDSDDWDSTENDVSSLQNSPRKPAAASSLVVLPEEDDFTTKSKQKKTNSNSEAKKAQSKKPPIAASPKDAKPKVFTKDSDSDSDSDEWGLDSNKKPESLVIGVDHHDHKANSPSIGNKAPQTSGTGSPSSGGKAAQAEVPAALLQQVTSLQETVSSLKTQLEKESVQNRELVSQVDSLQKVNGETRKQLEDVKQGKAALETEQSDMKNAYRKLESELRENTENRKQIESELEKLNKLTAERIQQSEKDKAEKDRAVEDLRSLRGEVDDFRSRMDTMEHEKDSMKRKVDQLAAENSRLQSALRDAEASAQAAKLAVAKAAAPETPASNANDSSTKQLQEMTASNAALRLQIEQLTSRHEQEIGQMRSENQTQQRKIQDLDKDISGLKVSLNEAGLRLEQERQSRNEIAPISVLQTDAETEAKLIALNDALSTREAQLQGMQDALESEKRRREAQEVSASDSLDKLRRVESFMQLVFATLRRHYKPGTAVQPVIDEINRMVSSFNSEASGQPDWSAMTFSTTSARPTPMVSAEQPMRTRQADKLQSSKSSHRPPTSTGTGTRNEVLTEESIVKHDARARTAASPYSVNRGPAGFLGQDYPDSSMPAYVAHLHASTSSLGSQSLHDANCRHSRDPASTLRASLGLTDRQSFVEGDEMAQMVPGSPSRVMTPDIYPDVNTAWMDHSNSIAALRLSREDAARAQVELERQRAMSAHQNLAKDHLRASAAEQKIEMLVGTIEKIQSDLKMSTMSLEEISKRSNQSRRSSKDGTRSGNSNRSASLPGGPRGILSKPAVKRSHNLSFNDLAGTSDAESSGSAESLDSVTDEDMEVAFRTQDTTLQNVKRQLTSTLESMKRQPDKAMILAESVSDAVMPILDSVARQIADQPIRAKQKAKRRAERKQLLYLVNEKLQGQTLQLDEKLDQLRSDTDRKFADRGEVGQWNRTNWQMMSTEDDVELMNRFREQQQRAKVELDKKRLECTIAAEQMHKEAKRELDNQIRQLKDALSDVSSQPTSTQTDYRSQTALHLAEQSQSQPQSQSQLRHSQLQLQLQSTRDSTQMNFRSINQPVLMRSNSSRPPLPTTATSTNSTILSRTSQASLKSLHSDPQEFKQSASMRSELTMARSSKAYPSSVQSSTVGSLNWDDAMPSSLQAYREHIYNKRLI